jgi:hypothetical protein
MWKHHAIYESRPRSVIITLGGHLYKIPEVVPTTAPPKQCYKVVSHTRKFIFSTICSKGEQKDTAATTASAKAPSIQQKQVDKVAAKHEDSFCTQSSKIARLVKKVQTFQPQVCDRFPQTKQRDFSSKTSSSPRCRFNKCSGGYRGPPTFSKWLKTVFWPFWQFTIFSRFSLPGPF